jgi:hypothetical protein
LKGICCNRNIAAGNDDRGGQKMKMIRLEGEEVSLSHTIRHAVGLLWTSDQPVAEASTYT